MQFAVSHITTFVLLLHLGMGCCLHHAHRCVVNCCDTPGPSAESCPCDSHSSHDDEAPHGGLASDTGEHQPPHSHHCEGDQCTFMRSSEPAPGEKGDLQLALCTLDEPPLTLDSGCDVAVASRTVDRPPPLPLRAHLLLSILLI